MFNGCTNLEQVALIDSPLRNIGNRTFRNCAVLASFAIPDTVTNIGVCALPGWQAVTVRLGWTPGDAAPAFREAESVDSLGLTHPIPASALPPEDWFRIDTIVSEMRLAMLVRRERVLAGYFLRSTASNGE